MIVISEKAKAIKTSPTLAVFSVAKKMMADGIDVINFGVGEPDFNTPEYIKEAAKKAIDENFTRYTVGAGIPELRKAIIKKLKTDNNLDYGMDEIIVTPGAKAAIETLLTTICNPGDQVIIPTPYWVSYPAQVELANGESVYFETEMSENFKINPVRLEQLIKTLSKPRAIILNSPSNPAGIVYSREELAEIAKVCIRHNIIIISDEIYEKLVYGNAEHYSIADTVPEVKNLTIVINGVSKAYAMTGWRLGYAAGPKEIIENAVKIQSHTASCINSITQKATVAALSVDDGSLEKMRQAFEERKKFMTSALNKIDHLVCIEPQGAFYCFPSIDYYIQNNSQGLKNDVELCTWLLEKKHIAVVPGSAFGVPQCLRFSYANSMENLVEGMKRFEEGLKELI
ncbi:MAG: pyridoxal phosphate-dependent aminotransferase [Candidatus Marinimicrobia bacterium]|nr:pyridoxal phosphate-dependent aminotransferase [Candidatus Neomarinimicrobiota bacterium]